MHVIRFKPLNRAALLNRKALFCKIKTISGQIWFFSYLKTKPSQVGVTADLGKCPDPSQIKILILSEFKPRPSLI